MRHVLEACRSASRISSTRARDTIELLHQCLTTEGKLLAG